MKNVLKFLVLLSVLLSPSFPATAAEKSDYTICAGDVLQVTVWKEEGLDREVLVLPDGTMTFPLIGTFKVEGMTPSDVQSTVKDKLRGLIPDASVTVSIKAPLGHTVSVLGQVAKPGEIVMARRMTVTQALSQAGGLTPFASESSIIVLHHGSEGETSTPVPYKDIIRGENLDKDIVLKPGDVVMVPTSNLF